MKKMFKNQSQEDCFHLKIGMRSNDSRLARLDGRTKPGRVLIHTRKSLTEHVGGYPTPAERLIIESAAIKSVRLFLLSEKLLTDGVIGCDQQDEKTIAWLNSLRLDLMALGLGRRIKDVSPSLAEIITSTQEQRRSTTPDFPIPPRGGASPARKAMAAAQSARMKARVAKRERAAPAECASRRVRRRLCGHFSLHGVVDAGAPRRASGTLQRMVGEKACGGSSAR